MENNILKRNDDLNYPMNYYFTYSTNIVLPTRSRHISTNNSICSRVSTYKKHLLYLVVRCHDGFE